MSEELADGLASFLSDVRLLEDLASYGRASDRPPPRTSERLAPNLIAYVSTPEGRTDVATWAEVFSGTLAALQEMRNEVAHSGVSDEDLERGTAAVDRCFDGLALWLASAC
jgi:hypothetical protein